MKKVKIIFPITIITMIIAVITMEQHFSDAQNDVQKASPLDIKLCAPQGCVFKTLFGEESVETYEVFYNRDQVNSSINKGLSWLVTAQQPGGGWGCGSHSNQHVRDPHAVASDPATTAMVAMAIHRSGSTLTKGPYSNQLSRGLNYLLDAVENTPSQDVNITRLRGTQIQTKLGANIDVILTSQFLSNILEDSNTPGKQKQRIQNALKICVDKIQRNQQGDGSFAGAGWAGVLQSSLANNALEMARGAGIAVDEDVLERSRNYQKGNYDVGSGRVNTDKGAGIVLYSVSGSTRASAAEARKVREEVDRAVKQGKVKPSQAVSSEMLESIGYAPAEAQKMATSYQVYESAKGVSQREDVLKGFGSDGGEEFLSYLQTGESLMINNDNGWENWFQQVSGRLISIQDNQGKWNGHHCITSPVFCTATCILVLSIENDIKKLQDLGNKG